MPLSHQRLINVAARTIAGMALLAASAGALPAEKYPKAIQVAVDNGAKVIRKFPAASGLTGWVLSENGRYSIIFSTADKKTVIAGALIDEKGENLTEEYEEKYFPKPNPVALFHELEQSDYVVEGTVENPKSTLYIFVDANCPFCHHTWKALQPYQKNGLQVRWVPVAMMGPGSMSKAIEVLAASDKTAAFRKMMESAGKGKPPAARFSEAAQPDIAEKIRKNSDLIKRFGISVTPGIVWQNRQGKIEIKAGMPRLSELPHITGLPKQEADDPVLTKYR